MPLIDLEQGSEKWLEYRLSKIMATDASVIIKNNPWCTPLEKWEEKLQLRPQQPMNAAMKRGQDLEPVARELFIKEKGISMAPCVYENEKLSWQAASLDGMCDFGSTLLEIKCPNESTHNLAIQGGVKDYYWTQIQHQLAVTNADMCYYFSYRPENKSNPYAIVEIFPDWEYISVLTEMELDFYIRICTMQPPEKPWVFTRKF